jgi:hypothetical protein
MGAAMDEGKRPYNSYSEAERARRELMRRLHKPFNVYGKGGTWYVGGVHMKQRVPAKTLKSFDEIKLLFVEEGPASDAEVSAYATEIVAETTAGKETIESGSESECVVVAVSLKTGHELLMNNSKTYLVLDLVVGDKRKQIQMGGAFERHIPLVMKQAHRLKGKSILWHTWNSAAAPTKWGHEKWFYMIEERLA